MWDIKKIQQMTWQCLLEYARHTWDAARKEADKDITYKSELGNYNRIWGGNEILYDEITLLLSMSCKFLARIGNIF